METSKLLFTNNQECSCLDGVCHLHKTYMQRTPQPRVSCPGRRDSPEVEVEEDEIRHMNILYKTEQDCKVCNCVIIYANKI